MLYEAEILLS